MGSRATRTTRGIGTGVKSGNGKSTHTHRGTTIAVPDTKVKDTRARATTTPPEDGATRTRPLGHMVGVREEDSVTRTSMTKILTSEGISEEDPQGEDLQEEGLTEGHQEVDRSAEDHQTGDHQEEAHQEGAHRAEDRQGEDHREEDPEEEVIPTEMIRTRKETGGDRWIARSLQGERTDCSVHIHSEKTTMRMSVREEAGTDISTETTKRNYLNNRPRSSTERT